MSEQKKANLFDDSDEEKDDYQPTAVAPAETKPEEMPAEAKPEENATEATNPPASEAAPAEGKRAIFDDDDDEGEYVPPVPQ